MTHAQNRILLRNGLVLDGIDRDARQCEVLVEHGMVRELLPPGTPPPADTQIIDMTDRLLMPGLVNAHTHAHGALGKGLVADRVSLEGFLAAAPAINGNRGTHDKYLSAKLSAVEMVRKGCTSCFDLATELPAPTVDGMLAVAQAYADVGMRAVVAPMMADKSLYQAYPELVSSLPAELQTRVQAIRAAPVDVNLQVCEALLKDWPFDRTRVKPGIAPTIPLHCSDDFLKACHRLSSEYGVPLQTHLAESRLQALFGEKRHGKSLVAHLQTLGLLDPRFSAAHAIWIDDDDIARLADAGATVAHNPLSNLRIGSGAAPVRRMLDAGLAVGIGTDSANTSDTQNMFEATRLASYLSRLDGADWTRWLGADEVFAMATSGSARVLGWQDSIGRIAPGMGADIVVLDLGHVQYVPCRDPLLQMAYGESGGAISDVMIAGEFVLRHGAMTTVDETALRSEVQAAVTRLDEANAGMRVFAHGLHKWLAMFCAAHGAEEYRISRRLSRP